MPLLCYFLNLSFWRQKLNFGKETEFHNSRQGRCTNVASSLSAFQTRALTKSYIPLLGAQHLRGNREHWGLSAASGWHRCPGGLWLPRALLSRYAQNNNKKWSSRMKSAFPKWKFLHRLIRMFEVEDVTSIPQNHVLRKVEKRTLFYTVIAGESNV